MKKHLGDPYAGKLPKLRITKVTSTPVTVPMNDSYSFSVGKVGGTSKIIIEVETSEGITGVGETFPIWTKSVLDEVVAPAMIGENPFNLERLTSKCLPTNANPSLPYVDIFHLLAFGGVEMALWDIAGKAVGLPSAMLMGGIYRTEVPFSDYVFVSGSNTSPKEYIEQVCRYCKQLVARYGSPDLEFKVGVMAPHHDIALVGAVRDAIGADVAIRLDANCAWTESTALRTIREMERFDVANIEEPCGTLEANAKIRRVVKTPISVHSTHVSDVVRYGLDAAVVNPLQVGGYRRLKKQISVAEDAGLDIWLHSRGELGFGTAAYLHFIASNRYLTLPSQTLIRPTEHMLTKEGKPAFVNGLMKLPTGEGLGVTLDSKAFDKYSALFKEEGESVWLNGSGTSPPFY